MTVRIMICAHDSPIPVHNTMWQPGSAVGDGPRKPGRPSNYIFLICTLSDNPYYEGSYDPRVHLTRPNIQNYYFTFTVERENSNIM